MYNDEHPYDCDCEWCAAPPREFSEVATVTRRPITMTAQTHVQHTPGPWHIETEWDDRGRSAIFGPTDGPGIALVIAPRDRDEAAMIATCDANARLIAAAPDLLAALEAMVGQYVAFVSQGAGNIHHQGDRLQFLEEHNNRVIAALDAIKKATGS